MLKVFSARLSSDEDLLANLLCLDDTTGLRDRMIGGSVELELEDLADFLALADLDGGLEVKIVGGLVVLADLLLDFELDGGLVVVGD